jgi:hypothetical protein
MSKRVLLALAPASQAGRRHKIMTGRTYHQLQVEYRVCDRRSWSRDLRPIDFRAHYREGRRGCNQRIHASVPALAIHRRLQLVADSLAIAVTSPGFARMAKKLKLQQEQAVIPAGNSGLGAKTVTSGEKRAANPAASTSGSEPGMRAKRAMTGRQQ